MSQNLSMEQKIFCLKSFQINQGYVLQIEIKDTEHQIDLVQHQTLHLG